MDKYLMNSALVSVILPTFNNASYLRDAVDSILNQTYSNFELIVIDDGSTDETNTILQQYEDARLRLIRHRHNRGLVASLNQGLSLAKGDYIARMDADDIASPNRLSLQLNYLHNHPEIGILGSWISVFGVDNYLWRTRTTHPEIVAQSLFECPIAHPSVIFRRSIITQLKPLYHPSFPSAEDYHLWVNAAKITRLGNIPEALLQYRTHSHQVGSRLKTQQQKSSLAVRKIALSMINLTPNTFESQLHQKMANWVAPNTLKELTAMLQWLRKVVRANKQNGQYYSLAALNRVTSERFVVTIIIAKSLGWWRYIYILLWPQAYLTAIRIVLGKYFPSLFSYYL